MATILEGKLIQAIGTVATRAASPAESPADLAIWLSTQIAAYKGLDATASEQFVTACVNHTNAIIQAREQAARSR